MHNKKTIYLHIGFEKTGSTSIQRFCVANSLMLSKQGVFYLHDPDSKLVLSHHHWPVAAAFADKNGFVPPAKRMTPSEAKELILEAADSTPCDTILLSAEPFSSMLLSVKNIQNLKTALSDFNVKIIAYLRRQDTFFLSHISTYVKGGNTFPLSNKITMTGTTIDYNNKNRYDYKLVLSRWEKVFGVENMIVRPFETASLVDGDIIADFLDVLNVSSGGLANKILGSLNIKLKGKAKTEFRENTSLSTEALLFLNLLNTRASKEFSRGYLGAVLAGLSDYPTKRKKQQLISNSHRQEIIDLYNKKNSFVAKHYMHDRSQLFVEPLPDVEEPWGKTPPLSRKECMDVTAHLITAVPNISAKIIAALCKIT